ncbi:peptidylprolyl isomerase [Psychromonas sp. B3M02]|uniref:FKBP-type peptidyl-prolyl cis-trans isomerase n=1 Tax=unclassified Psychromonas TaxID=2614957 RepID=UPI000DE88149|nr:peptidylprolyl isomerase [Psychromonas sp. B3M02]RBW47240.1 peptidylprolyl isomerase [Psychromonas sp. B3M02]
MQIAKNSVVEFHYRVSEGETLLENSQGNDPLLYLHGHGGLFETMEAAFVGKSVGDEFEVTLTPEQSYGERRESAIQRIPLKHLQGAKKWSAGMVATVESNQGKQEVTIIKVGRFNADCDLNHPFAGKTLTFNIQVASVREATADEISHGHAHAKGGCGH